MATQLLLVPLQHMLLGGYTTDTLVKLPVGRHIVFPHDTLFSLER